MAFWLGAIVLAATAMPGWHTFAVVSPVFAADLASVDNVAIDLGVARIHIGHLEAKGTPLDGAALAALLDPKNPLGIAERLDRLTAASITASDVTFESKDPGGAFKLSYGALSLTDIHRGRIAKLAATGGALSHEGPAPQAIGTIGDLRCDNLDLALLVRSLGQARADADEPLQSFLEHAAFDGFHLSVPGGGAVSMGKWSASDIRMRPLLGSTRSFPAAVRQSSAADDVRMEAQVTSSAIDILSSLTIGDLEIRDIGIRTEQAREPVTFDLSRLHLAGIGRGKFDEVAIEGLGLDTPNAKLKLALYAIRGFDLGSVLAPLFRIGRLSDRQAGKSLAPDEAKQMLAAIAQFYDAFAVRSAEVRDLLLTTENDANPISIRLTRYGLADVAHARLGDLAIQGFAIEAGDGHFKLGELALHGLDFRATLEGVSKMAAEGAPLPPAAWLGYLPTLDQFVLAGVDVDTPDRLSRGNSAGGKRDAVRLGRLEIDAAHHLGGIPPALSMSLDHVAFDLSATAADPQLQHLSAMGYSSLDLSMRFEASWDAAAKELTLKELSIGGLGMGTVTLAGKLANVPAEAFSGDIVVAEAAWLAALVKEADLRVVDTGLLDKEVAVEAAASKVTPERRRQDILAAIAIGIPRALGTSPATDAIAKAVDQFIRAPRSLHIVARSADGLGVADFAALKSPDALLRRLDVKAVANQ